jgi:hypothetical protein
LKVREDLNAAKKLVVVNFFIVLLLFESWDTWDLVYHAVTYIVKVIILVAELTLLYTSENGESVTQRRILLGLAIIGSCIGLTLSIIPIATLESNSNVLTSLVLRDASYFGVSVILFVTAYKDYKLFGSGLKEYYQKKRTKTLKL